MKHRVKVEGGEMPDSQDGSPCAGSDAVLDDAQSPMPSVPPVAEDEPAPAPSRTGCRTELRGWAGAHLHGAVRPRRRVVAGRGRPPGRWC
jgi:hypothetical protein